MPSPDDARKQALRTELKRMQERAQQIQHELKDQPPPETRTSAAERAAKRWGLGAVIVGIGSALWLVTRTQPQVLAALGFVATAAAGVVVGVLLPDAPDSVPSQATPPTATNERTPPTAATTTSPEPTQDAPDTPPDETPELDSEPTTEPPVQVAEAEPTTAPAPDQPPAEPQPQPEPEPEQPPDERNENAPTQQPPPTQETPDTTQPPPDCTGLHVDASPVAEACVLGESVLEAEVLG